MRIFTKPTALAWILLAVSTQAMGGLAPDLADRIRQSVVAIETPDGSSGSGVFVDGTGLLITCSHVMETQPGRVTIRFADESTGEAEFLSFDPTGRDLAALRLINRPPPAHLEVAAGSTPRIGQRIYLCGNPYRLFPSLLSSGMVGFDRPGHNLFVHDAASSSGTSGSPVVDEEGRVIGVSVSVFFDDQNDAGSSYTSGFNSAIDASALRAFIERIANGDRFLVKTGHLEYLRYPLQALKIGHAFHGMLTAECDRNPGDLSFSQGFTLDAEQGDMLHLTLKSKDFDAFLLLHDDKADLLQENDDGPVGGSNSAILFEVPATARYIVVATSLEPGETGKYALLARHTKFGRPEVTQAALVETDPKDENGMHYRSIPVQGKPGRWISVTMRSGELDSMLRLVGPDGSTIAENDDWQEGTLDARVLAPIPGEGKHSIIATTVGEAGATGPFELETAWSDD